MFSQGLGRYTVTSTAQGLRMVERPSQAPAVFAKRPSVVQAAGMGGPDGGRVMMSGMGMAKNTTLGIMDGVLDAHNTSIIRQIYKDIYYHDSIGGSAVDLMANLPFSDFDLTGINDITILRKYMQCVENLKLKSFLPAMSVDYHVLGAFVGSLKFDTRSSNFVSICPHNLDTVEMTEVPLYGADPLIDLRYDHRLLNFLKKVDDPRARAVMEKLPSVILENQDSNRAKLDPRLTLYIPRMGFASEHLGTSYFRRLLPIFILEKALLRGTIDQAYRRQRPIMHVSAGNETWTPSNSELSDIAATIQSADADPVNAVVATRQDINVEDIKRGDDFWRYDNIYDFSSSAKMRALGISDAFLSGEASYNTSEVALSVFMDQLRAFRALITRKLFYEKLFPTIAVANGYLKKSDRVETGSADSYRYGNSYIHRDDKGEYVATCGDSAPFTSPEDVDISRYQIPLIAWHKQLKPEADENYINMLNTLSDRGVPVPVRIMAAAGGLNLDQIINQFPEDIAVRKKIKAWQDQVAAMYPEEEQQEGDQEEYSNATPDVGSMVGTTVKPVGIQNRKYDDEFDMYQVIKGKRKPVTAKAKKAMDERVNRSIAAAAANLAKKHNYKAKQHRNPSRYHVMG